MKRIISFALILLTLIMSLSSCAPKYTFNSPYVHKDYTSESMTVLSHNGGSRFLTQAGHYVTVGEYWEIITAKEEYAVLRVSRMSSVSKCMDYEFNGEKDYCGYTVTTLKVLEVLDGTGNVFSEMENKETLSILEPYYVTPDGEACVNMMNFIDGKGAERNILAYKESYQLVISSSDEYVLVFVGDGQLKDMTKLQFRKIGEYPADDFNGLYYTPYVFECSERAYLDGKECIKKYESIYPIVCYDPHLFQCMSAFLYEKYHAV